MAAVNLCEVMEGTIELVIHESGAGRRPNAQDGPPTLRMCAATRRRLSAMRLPSYSVIETRTEFLEASRED